MMKIKSIERNKFKTTVYDIETPTHDYILSNGVISHNTQEIYAKPVLSGGTGIMLASDLVWLIGRSQEKDGTELAGYNFTIKIEKSRYVREKSSIPITVKFEGGVSKYTGMLDIAIELGAVVKPSNGWFSPVDMTTGEISTKKFRRADTDTPEFWDRILNNQVFKDKVAKRFKVANGSISESSTIIEDEDD